MTRTLVGLHPFVKQQAEALLIAANNRLKHHKMIITQGFRSKEEQDKIYAQGRTTPGKIVTNAKGGHSMHNYGLAIDFALLTPDGKKAVWDTYSDFDKDGMPDWSEVVEEAKKLGFVWGGDWKSFVDKPHLEMTGGLSIQDLQSGIYPTFDFKKPAVKVSNSTHGINPKSVIPYPGKPFKVSSPVLTGKDVERIQRAVGMKESEIDGKYGPKTAEKVKEYQKKHKLKQDGIVGPECWDKMF